MKLLWAFFVILAVGLFLAGRKERQVEQELLEHLPLPEPPKYRNFDGDGAVLTKDICNWHHNDITQENPGSFFQCGKCDYAETFQPPFLHGGVLDTGKIDDVIWEHYIKCHYEIVDAWQAMIDFVPGSKVKFAYKNY